MTGNEAVQVNRFNIRVYGILQHEGKVLLVHEKIGDLHYTKFPGGGLEFGESTKACLIREFREESGLDIEVTGHFYTTDIFQRSGFNPADQLMAVYYHVKALGNPADIPTDEFDLPDN